MNHKHRNRKLLVTVKQKPNSNLRQDTSWNLSASKLIL